jgi:hypothetical protein
MQKPVTSIIKRKKVLVCNTIDGSKMYYLTYI